MTSNRDRGLRQQINLYVCFQVAYLWEIFVLVVCATCPFDIRYSKEGKRERYF